MSEREGANKMDKGSRKYNERIHRESRYADTHKNLPFKFSKPLKRKSNNVLVVCKECTHDLHITQETIIVVCSWCGYMNKVKDEVKL
ncbi:MAG: hypothetical protein KAS32_26155 [Candidatus Peribacteraceae bacterium]|nr:hypothetical protein [Candidatus Peribacteraceae bacterium]